MLHNSKHQAKINSEIALSGRRLTNCCTTYLGKHTQSAVMRIAKNPTSQWSPCTLPFRASQWCTCHGFDQTIEPLLPSGQKLWTKQMVGPNKATKKVGAIWPWVTKFLRAMQGRSQWNFMVTNKHIFLRFFLVPELLDQNSSWFFSYSPLHLVSLMHQFLVPLVNREQNGVSTYWVLQQSQMNEESDAQEYDRLSMQFNARREWRSGIWPTFYAV
jgi:hypothetical protein